MSSCLQAIIIVIERQYSRYFTFKLWQETTSARSHNIDSEEIMGMFNAAQKSHQMQHCASFPQGWEHAKKPTLTYLDELLEERGEEVLKKAVRLGRMQRDQKRQGQKELRRELIKRKKDKEEVRDNK